MAARSRDPGAGGVAAGGDQAVDVRMKRQPLTPGVEGEEGAGPGAEVAGIGGQLEQRVARALEEQGAEAG